MSSQIAGAPASLDRVLAGLPAGSASSLSALRRELHRWPELSWREERTGARLADALRALGASDVRTVARTGVVARLPGRDPAAPVVAVRGDIDALPIHESTGLPFSSEVSGVMHACGHDVHATWAVGAAWSLVARPAAGDVLVVLQPAEEVGEGALAVLESGALDGVAAIFGAHVDRRFALGEVVAQAGPLAASTDTFEVTVEGAGAHGARPHEGIDPVVAGAAIVVALQTAVSRRLEPAQPGVVTVGVFRAGDAANVIPAHATLQGTIRATTPGARALLLDEVRHIAEETAGAHRARARVEFREATPPLVNPPEPVMWAREAVARVLGEEALVPLGTTNMGGEDFAFYLERMPGCFLRIGAREPGGAPIPAHSPSFHAAEESVFVGAAVLAESARVASDALSRGPSR